ncbi:MAG: AsmA-like C-terminal region-containing protein [Planctomycetota bacterium]|nr:AsmA-like C-terminal region-containing protein [Planctomycetota bacterium]
MKRLLRLLRGLVVIVALVAVAAVGGALVFEATGGVERMIQQELDTWVAEEPDLEVSFRSAHVDWSTPALELDGLHVVGGEGELFLESLELFFDLSPGAPSRLHGIEVGRGRVVVERAFAESIQRTVTRVRERLAPPPTEPLPEDLELPAPAMPTIGLDGLEVALRLPDGELIELGAGEARLELVDEDLSLRGSINVPQDQDAPRPLHFAITMDPGGTANLSASTRNLEVASRGNQLRRLLPPALRGLDFAMRASADVESTFAAGRPAATTAHLRLERGYLRAGPDAPALEDLVLVGDLEWREPAPGLDLWRGTTGRAEFTAGILGETLTGRASMGPAGVLQVDLSNRGLDLGEELLAAAGLPPEHPARTTCYALGLAGRADLDVGLRLDLERDLTRPGVLLEALDLAADVRSDGKGSFRYNGFALRGQRQGFPLRADRVQAQVVVGLAGKNRRNTLVGIVDAEASHGTGLVRARGLIADPLVPRKEPDLDLLLEVEDRALDADLREGLAGMQGTAWIWDAFSPGGGSIDATIRLRDRAATGGMNAQLDLVATAAPMRWSQLPVDLFVDELELKLRWSRETELSERGIPLRSAGAFWRARGSSASVADLEVVGMSRDRTPLGAQADPPTASLYAVRASGSGLALRGSDFDGLAEVVEGLEEITTDLGAKGRVDFTYFDASVADDGRRELTLEARPAVVQLLPTEFPVVVRDVTGRLNLSGHPGAPAVLHSVVSATWPAGHRLAAHAVVELPEPGAAAGAPGGEAARSRPGTDRRVSLAAAGLDPSNQALLGALGARGELGSAGLDSGEDTPELDGRLDLSGVLVAGPDGELEPELTLHLRGNGFRSGSLELGGLEGQLALAGGALVGPRITGNLAGTQVVLREARFALEPAAREGDVFFSTAVDAEDLPLDREHLLAFLEPEALDALIDDFGWRGQVDLDAVDLELARSDDGQLRVSLAGHLVPSAMRLVVGAPIEITRAQVELEEFVYESGRARAWGRTQGLFGGLAGREVRDADLLFSYVDQRLTIEDLDAAFAGGRLTSPGGGKGLALALDLASPHHLVLGVELQRVQAGELLAGAFGGGKNQGTIDASVRLEARPGDLLAATGAGWVRIDGAQLFSIPVFRELFTQLGFDATAVFDSMRTTFSLADGVVALREMQAHSPLLKLVGAGAWNLDGGIVADLEVRYSVVDKLGPLRFFVYWFQDSILRVAIRGDVYRPVVLLRNSILDFLGMEEQPGVRLPLPPRSQPRW